MGEHFWCACLHPFVFTLVHPVLSLSRLCYDETLKLIMRPKDGSGFEKKYHLLICKVLKHKDSLELDLTQARISI
jgi:hypothetical protein